MRRRSRQTSPKARSASRFARNPTAPWPRGSEHRKSPEIQRDVIGKQQPEERPGHVLDEGPDEVALAVIDGEIATLAGRGRSEMARGSRRRVKAPIACEP